MLVQQNGCGLWCHVDDISTNLSRSHFIWYYKFECFIRELRAQKPLSEPPTHHTLQLTTMASNPTKPVIVLIPGGFHRPSSWSRVAASLREMGYTVQTP